MKRFRTMKKALSLLMSMMMVFALGTAAFAADGQDTSAYYYQNEKSAYATSEPITVYVTIESYRTSITGSGLLKTRIPVTLDPAGEEKTFTVTDAFVTLQDDTSNGIAFLDSSKEKLTADGSYVMYVQSGSTVYGPSSQYSFDGWMVRINDRFAILGDDPAYGGLYGAAINTTYLSNGDEIHFYMDNTSSESSCVKYTALDAGYANGTLTVNVQESHNWFDAASPYTWHITDFAPYDVPNAAFTIYKTNGDTVVGTFTGKSGSVITLDVDLTAGETYTIVMGNRFKTGIINGKMLEYTSASTVFTVPSAS